MSGDLYSRVGEDRPGTVLHGSTAAGDLLVATASGDETASHLAATPEVSASPQPAKSEFKSLSVRIDDSYEALFVRRGQKEFARKKARIAALDETLNILFVLAQERLAAQEDRSKGWFYFGETRDASRDVRFLEIVFSRAVRQAKSGKFKSAFQALEAASTLDAERTVLGRLFADPLCQQLNDLGQEPDLLLRRESLLWFARNTLLMDHQMGMTARLISESLRKDPELQNRAAKLTDLIDGKGGFGDKAQLFGHTFVDRFMSPAMILATIGAGLAGPAAEAAGLHWFARWGSVRDAASIALGVGAESFVFTTLHSVGEAATHDADKLLAFDRLSKDWKSAASLFAGMRAMHYVAGLASQRVAWSEWGRRLRLGEVKLPVESTFRMGPTGRMLPERSLVQLTRRGRILHQTLNHTGGVSGMTAMSYVNQWLGFQPVNSQGFWGHVNDAALMYGDSIVGSHVANRLDGYRAQAFAGRTRALMEEMRTQGFESRSSTEARRPWEALEPESPGLQRRLEELQKAADAARSMGLGLGQAVDRITQLEARLARSVSGPDADAPLPGTEPRSEVDALLQAQAGFRRQLSEAQAEAGRLRKELEAVQREKAKAAETAANLRGELEQVTQGREGDQQAATQRETELAGRLAQAQAEVAAKVNEAASLEARLNTAQQEAATKVERLEEQLALMEETGELLSTQLGKLYDIIAVKDRRIAQFEGYVDDLRTMSKEATREIVRLNAEISRLSGEKASALQRIEGLEAHNSGLAGNLASLREATAAYIQEVNGKLDRAAAHIAAKAEEVRAVEGLLQEKIGEFSKLQQEKFAAEQAMEQRLQDLQRLHDEQVDRANQAEWEVYAKEIELQGHRGLRRSREEIIASLTQANQRLEAELAAAQVKLGEKEGEVAAKASALQDLQGKKDGYEAETKPRIARLEAELQAKQGELAALEARRSEAEKRAAETQQEIGGLRPELARLQGKIVQKNEEVRRLGEELAQVRETAEAFARAYFEGRAEFETNQAELTRQRDRVARLTDHIRSMHDARVRSDNHWGAQVVALSLEVRGLKQSQDLLSRQVEEWQAKAQQESERAEAMATASEGQIRQLQGETEQLQQRLQEARRDHRLAEADLRKALQELSSFDGAWTREEEILRAELEQQKSAAQQSDENVQRLSGELRDLQLAHGQERAILQAKIQSFEILVAVAEAFQERLLKMVKRNGDFLHKIVGSKNQLIAAKNQRIDELNAKIAQMNKAQREDSKSITQLLGDLSRAKRDFKAEVALYEAEIDSLEARYETRRVAFNTLEARVKAAEANQGKAKAETVALRTELEAERKALAESRTELEVERRKVSDLQTQQADLEGLRDELYDQVLRSARERDAAEQQLLLASHRIEELSVGLDVKTREAEAARSEAVVLESNLHLAETAADHAHRRLYDKSGELQTLRQEFEILTWEKARAEAEQSRLERELIEARDQAAANVVQAAKVPDLERRLGGLNARIAEQAAALGALRTEVEEARAAANAAQQRAEETQGRLEARQAELSTAAERIMEANARAEQAAVELQRAREEYRGLSTSRPGSVQALGKALTLQGNPHPLDPSVVTTLGRTSDNDIIVSERSVSRRQAIIFHDEGSWRVVDLRDSQDPRPLAEQQQHWTEDFRTLLNGAPIPPGGWNIKDGDVLGYGKANSFYQEQAPEGTVKLNFGDVTLRFQIDPVTQQASLARIDISYVEPSKLDMEAFQQAHYMEALLLFGDKPKAATEALAALKRLYVNFPASDSQQALEDLFPLSNLVKAKTSDARRTFFEGVEAEIYKRLEKVKFSELWVRSLEDFARLRRIHQTFLKGIEAETQTAPTTAASRKSP